MKRKRFYMLEEEIIAEIARLARTRRQTLTAVVETAVLTLARQDAIQTTPTNGKQVQQHPDYSTEP